jgi:two-component system C4-dicarboxylate transport sensor histidine kinase DctB
MLTAEAGRLEQVLVNLLRNGLDSMVGQSEPLLEIFTRALDGVIAIEIRDHGRGLADEARTHLFEPFFTTKTAGEGLGLGLAISLTIVESYGGTLSAQNAQTGGAIFVLTLPAAGDPDAAPDT